MCVLQLTFFTFLYVIYDFVMINDIVNSLLITFFAYFITGIRQEQDIYVRLIDSATKQVRLTD